MTYGSLTNRLMERGTRGQPTPAPGMGATILLYSDRHAATIVSVKPYKAGWLICVEEDTARVVSGNTMDGSAVYAYERNPGGRAYHFRTDHPDVRWVQVSYNPDTRRWRRMADGVGLRIGEREEYRDPSF